MGHLREFQVSLELLVEEAVVDLLEADVLAAGAKQRFKRPCQHTMTKAGPRHHTGSFRSTFEE